MFVFVHHWFIDSLTDLLVLDEVCLEYIGGNGVPRDAAGTPSANRLIETLFPLLVTTVLNFERSQLHNYKQQFTECDVVDG